MGPCAVSVYSLRVLGPYGGSVSWVQVLGLDMLANSGGPKRMQDRKCDIDFKSRAAGAS